MATPVIDTNNPWPWLDPFTENAQAFFNGRDDDSAALERCVVSGTATVLFGKSGLGKTSLLQAGLFPRLRKAGLLPVLVRLAHGVDSPPAAAQIRVRLYQECIAQGLAIPGNRQLAPQLEAPEDRLWLDLHTIPVGLQDKNGRNWQPVLVLDQFEEIFTLGGQDATRQQRDFGALGDLIENRIPNALEKAIGADEDLLDFLLLDAQPYRVILSLREDYLPNLERWCDRMPRLGPNRYRLLPMNEAQALDAIRLTGGDLVTPEDAERIVRFVASQQEGPAVGMASGESADASIEPALLSLLCSGLNLERQTAGAPRLDASDLEQRGGRIMERFYDDATKGVAAAAVAFLEDELITPDGVRLFYPLKSILQNPGITKRDIDTLIDRRLLRRQPFLEGERIEVVHDRLAAVARQRRKAREIAIEQQHRIDDARLEAEAREANEHARLERKNLELKAEALERAENDAVQLRHLQQRLKLRLAALAAMLGITSLLAVYAYQQTGLARRAQEQATIRQLIAEGPVMPTGPQYGGPMFGMLRVLAVHRLAAERFPEASPAAFGALQTEWLRRARLVRLLENNEDIATLALSPDGSHIISGSSSGNLRFWDVVTGRSAAFKGHEQRVTGIAYSPDGKHFVSGGMDGKLRLWNATPTAPIGPPFVGDPHSVTSVAYSPDGMYIVSGGADGKLRLWNTATRAMVGAPFVGGARPVTSVTFSPDGRHIVSGHGDGGLGLWDTTTGALVRNLTGGHTEPVNSVGFSPDGRLIVSGSDDNTLRLWNTASGQLIGQPLVGHKDNVNSVAFSPDGRYLVSGSRDSTVRLWDVGSSEPWAKRLTGHSKDVTSVTFSADGKFIVSGSKDNTLCIWSTSPNDAMSEAFELPGKPNARVRSVAFSPDGKSVAAGTDKIIFLWDVSTSTLLGSPFAGHTEDIYSIAYSPDGERIASGGKDKTLRLWDAATGIELAPPLTGHTDTIYGIAFSPDGKRIASASEDQTVRLWDAATGEQVGNPFAKHTDIVFSVDFSPLDGKRIASVSGDKTLRLWDAASGTPLGKPMMKHTRSVNSLAFSPDGQRIVTGSNDLTLRLWDVATQSCPIVRLLMDHPEVAFGVNFRRLDGKRIVTESNDKTLRRLGDVATKSCPVLKPLTGHTDYVNSVAFGPDGKYIVSGSRDGKLRLWDATSGDPVGIPLEGHTDSVLSVAFSPDGKHAASGGFDTTLRHWPILESWAEALCAKLPRNMTHAEWQKVIPAQFAYIKQCPNLPVPPD
ncbi:MAG TPA: hypothetical protein PLC99_24660 [Verrucomicrobiota bacterium]|nr:hypothetical protein [Verrucomicrobiota bacterium]